MAGTDIVSFGNGHYGVRDLYDAWRAAGSPPINDSGRLYAQQKAAWDAYQNGTGSPADNPDQPGNYELAHTRFAALDITATDARVLALSAAGLVRPFSYESWHWRLRNIYNYPIVTAIPASAASGGSTPLEDDMTPEQAAQLAAAVENSAEARRMVGVILGAIQAGNAGEAKLWQTLNGIGENAAEGRRMGGVVLGAIAPAPGESRPGCTVPKA